jgi:UDPglucose 6-dehydrogenase
VETVRAGIGLDSRIGGAFMAAGPGFGGSCLPSQIDMLTSMSEDLGIGLELIPAVGQVNRELPRRLIRDLLASRPTPKRVAVLGLAFKANTNDTRESPSLRLIGALREYGVHDIRAYDPAVRHLPSHPWVDLVEDPYSAAIEADILIVATEWDEFRTLDWARLGDVMSGRDVFDARSVVELEAAVAAGFEVQSVDRRARPRASVAALPS